ncbi:MAG: T9SS type A sorting domain-containing protein [Bacteroidia bacterium]
MKKTILYATLFLLSLPLAAQVGLNLEWKQEINNKSGAKVKELHAVHATAGGTIVAGSASSQGGISLYAAKHQPSGQLLWDTTITTSSLSIFNFLAEDAQGNIYAAGTEVTGGFFDRQTHFVKLNSSGQVQWHTTYQGVLGPFATVTDLKVVGSNVYMCGNESAIGGRRSEYGFLVKFDLDGNVVWEKRYDPGVITNFESIAIDNSGTVVVAGSADGEYAFLAVQYNSTGNFEWQYPDTIPDQFDEQYFKDVEIDASGNVYLIGSEEVGSFEKDIVTYKVDDMGAMIWEGRFNNRDENEGVTVRIAPNGNIYAIGDKEISFDDYALVIAYDDAGNKQWESDYVIDDRTTVKGVEITSNSEIFLGVQEFDSLGFVKFSSTGVQLASKTYGQDEVDFLTGISLSNNDLVGVAYKRDDTQSALFSLQNSDLSENQVTITTGLPLSNAQPGAMTNDNNHLWISSFADAGDTGRFSIQKMDLAGNLIWEKTKSYESTNQRFEYLAHDGSGNIIGLFQNNTSISVGHLGLVKYDASGVEQFTVLLDSASVYRAGGLAVDNGGDIYINGYNTGTRRMFLSRYSAAGVLQWTKDYVSPSTTFPFAIGFEMEYTAQGKLVIAADHKGANNDNDLHLFQYATDGTLEWHKDVAVRGGNSTDFSGMEISPAGDITVFGTSSIGSFVAARFDKDGTLVWDDKGSLPATGAPRSMAIDGQGKVHLCFSTSTHFNLRILDASGAFVSDHQYSIPSSGGFFFPRYAAISSGNLAVFGDHIMRGQTVPFEMLIDNQQNLIYARLDSSTFAQPKAIMTDPSDNVYSLDLRGDLQLAAGYRGMRLRKFNVGTVGIDALPFGEKDAMSVYPNPTNSKLTVALDVPQPGIYELAIFDLHGRKIANLHKAKLPSGSTSIGLQLPANIPGGTYLLGVKSDHGTAFRKVSAVR